MLALPQEYIGATCEVKSMENDLLCMGRIIKIDSEALEIAGRDGDRLPLLQYRLSVKLFIYHGKMGTRILVGTVYLSTENFLRAEEVRPLQNFERRGAFRVNTSVKGHLSLLLGDEEQTAFDAALGRATPEEAERMLARATFDVRVMDVSLAGARLQSDLPLAIGTRYILEFQLLNTDMSLCMRVQRNIRMANSEIQYGCTFFDVSERQVDTLCKELFQLQRLEKNRRMNSAAAI